jgi:radical SAM superfamily enzyme YgiQ (UPF0313 family)
MGINIVLINPYELGRQPFGLAHPAAWLRHDGHNVACLDLSQNRLDEAPLADADLIAVQLAMHTATRIAGEALPNIRAVAPNAHVAAFGLYSRNNASWLGDLGVETLLGGEFEVGLRALAKSLADGSEPAQATTSEKLEFMVPDRRDLAELSCHARLRLADGTEVTMGFAETTRGCKHLCRHCPVVPVYQGRFRAIPADIVLADIRQQVAAGAEHISFGDPDFLNGPTHGLRIVRAMHKEFPDLTFDAVIKVEHLLAQRDILAELAECGLRLVISAVESVDDTVLGLLAKGHTRADFASVVPLMREHNIAFAPTFLAFTPWITLEGYLDLLSVVVELDLIDNVPAIQLAIRLLVPAGSALMDLPEFVDMVLPFDENALGYPWVHVDPRVDALQQKVQQAAERADTLGESRRTAFEAIWRLTHEALGLEPSDLGSTTGKSLPHHTENWYCCAEPTSQQLAAW